LKFREFFFTTDYTDYSDFIRWWVGYYTDWLRRTKGSFLISQMRVVPTLEAIRMGFRQESRNLCNLSKFFSA